ncbi:MAG: hypothetical protein NE327_11755 [Lentisphaeraceae bacterium]|nr:hypothetical protein [Lentisphaeraceae bacterium]
MKTLSVILFLFISSSLSAAEQYIIISASKYPNYYCVSMPMLIDVDKYKDDLIKDFILEEDDDIYPSSSVKIYKANSAAEVKKMSKFSSTKYKLRVSKGKLKRFARSRGVK